MKKISGNSTSNMLVYSLMAIVVTTIVIVKILPSNETTIQYRLPAEAHVKMSIYNLAGQVVVTLVNQIQSAGLHSVQ